MDHCFGNDNTTNRHFTRAIIAIIGSKTRPFIFYREAVRNRV